MFIATGEPISTTRSPSFSYNNPQSQRPTHALVQRSPVAALPRIFIGATAWLADASLKRVNEYLALVVAAVVGTLTNPIGVLTIAVLRGYMAPGVAWKRVETGRGEARM